MTRVSGRSISFRARLLSLLGVTLVTGGALALFTSRTKVEELGTNRLDLSEHVLSERPAGSPGPVVFVGGDEAQAVARGMNAALPSRDAYALTGPRENILTSMAHAAMSKPHHPRLVVLSISNEAFFSEVALPFSGAVIERQELLSGYVPEELLRQLRERADWRLRIFLKESRLIPRFWSPPLQEFVNFESLRARLYSQPFLEFRPLINGFPNGETEPRLRVWIRDRKAQLLESFKRLVENGGSRLVAYQAPRRLKVSDNLNYEFAQSRENLRILQSAGIPCLDYFDLFTDRRELFLDEIHLTDPGGRVLADKLRVDLVAAGSLN